MSNAKTTKINFYDIDNYIGLITQDKTLADSYMEFPSFLGINPTNTDKIFGTRIKDDLMSNNNIKKGTDIIVRYDICPDNDSIVVANIIREKKIVVRKYKSEGDLIYLWDSTSTKIEYNKNDIEILGVVVKALTPVN